jgi:hypothetical protein
MRSWQTVIVFAVLSGVLLVAPGCASQQRSPERGDTVESMERPAVPLEDEETLSDKIGEVGVVLLVVGAVVVPIVLLLVFKPF